MLLDQLFNRTSGVAETSDYARRREREEAIISGKKPPRKKQPAQTSDYARRRAQEKAKEQGMAEAGPFSYGAKRPRKGTVAYNAMMKRQEQERGKQPIEPQDQMVGTAKVTKNVAEGSEIKIPTEDGIGWQDIRLLAGEGKLTQKTIKQAINIIRRQRKEQGVAEAKADPLGAWIAHKTGTEARKFKTREGAKKYVASHDGFTVSSSEAFHDTYRKKKVQEVKKFRTTYGWAGGSKEPRSAHAKQVAANRKEYEKGLGKFEPTDDMVGTAKMIKDIATSNASPEHKKAAIDALNKKGVAETNVSKYADMGATNSTTHFIKNITTGKIVSPHRSRQDAEDALVANMRDSDDEFKIVGARKEGTTEAPGTSPSRRRRALDTAAAQKRGEPTPDQLDAKLYQDWYQRLQKKKSDVAEAQPTRRTMPWSVWNAKSADDQRFIRSQYPDHVTHDNNPWRAREGVAEGISTVDQPMICPECGGPAFTDLLLAEKKDACYNKVRSRYKVWPSAYASGALVQCRKKGAANWGNKS